MHSPEDVTRFSRAYWRALHELDVLRLRQWERSNLTLPQLRVLFQLRRLPGTTTGELAREMGISMSTASGLVIKLEGRGLVERTSAPGDRRREPLLLTSAGTELVGEISEANRPVLEAIAEQLGSGLARVTAALEQLGAAAAEARDVAPQPGPPEETVALPARKRSASGG